MTGKTSAARGEAAARAAVAWTQRVGPLAHVPALVRQLGGDPSVALASVGLATDALDDPQGRIPYAALGRLLSEASALTQCAHFGLLAGRMWHLADLGIVGDATRYAATVAEALQALTDYQHLNSGGGLAFVMRRAGTVDFGYAIYHPGVPGADQVYDSVLAAGYNFLRELCGPGWRPTEVFLPHARPPDTEPYRRLFRVPPRFNAEFCAIRFPDSWMGHRVDTFDPARWRQALRRAEHAGRGLLVDQVFRALRILMLRGRISGDEVAQMLSMHRRTLNRRLKAEGTTFQRVLDDVRFEVACQLLAESEIALDDIAATLGYAGVSPFMRTFRRWAGTTPGRWRRAAVPSRFHAAERRRQPAFGWPAAHRVAIASD